MKFKVGDRVAVYFNGTRLTGSVVGYNNEEDSLAVLKSTATDYDTVSAHPKQCRLLKKKERRRIWIHRDAYFKAQAISREMIGFSREMLHDTDIEFIEVKKK